MIKILVRNTLISILFSVVVAFFSHQLNNTDLNQTIRWALYDILILQTFLTVLEMYKDRSSDINKLMNENRYSRLIQNLSSYQEKQEKDNVLDELITETIEQCIQYSRLDSINEHCIPINLAEKLAQKYHMGATQKRIICHIDKFDKHVLDSLSKVIIVFDQYSEIYSRSETFIELSKEFEILFYRKQNNLSIMSFCIFNNDLVLVDEDGTACQVLYTSDQIKRYSEIFSDINNQAAPIGMTQPEDSLFKYQSIKEFYGPGNSSELHLDMIKTPFRKILDLGTGAGRLLKYFEDSSKYEVVAIDQDQVALNECEKVYGGYDHITLRKMEFNEYSFSPEEFDLIIAYNSLYHTNRKRIFEIMRRIHMILKPGGHLIFTLKTLEGNESIYRNATELDPSKKENTFLSQIAIYRIIFVIKRK